MVSRLEQFLSTAVNRGSPAFVELTGLPRDIVIAMSTNQAAKAAVSTLNVDGGDSCGLQRTSVALQSVIDQARSDHAVKDDLFIEDCYLLMSSIPAGQPTGVLNKWIDLILFGIAVQKPGGTER